MSILSIILVIVVVGVILWAINSFVPMDSKVKSILNIVVVLLLIFWLLQAFGLLSGLGSVRVGSLAAGLSQVGLG
jgi:predicted membrane protein